MRKILPLAVLVSSAACGDTNNYYNVSGGSGDGKEGSSITSCEEYVEKNYQCNPQKYKDYQEMWGVSIEDQKKHGVDECEKGNWFATVPEAVACMEKSCEYINSGACAKILEDAGF